MKIIYVCLKTNSEGTEEYDVKSITSAASHPRFHSPK